MRRGVAEQLGREIELALLIDPDVIRNVTSTLVEGAKLCLGDGVQGDRCAASMLLISAAIEDAATADESEEG